MKTSFRTIAVMACMVVFVASGTAQLGKSKGGGSGNSGGQSGPTKGGEKEKDRQTPPPRVEPPRTGGSHGGLGRGQGVGSQTGGTKPIRGGGNTDPGRDRTPPPRVEPPRTGGSQGGGLGKGQGSGNSGGSQTGGTKPIRGGTNQGNGNSGGLGDLGRGQGGDRNTGGAQTGGTRPVRGGNTTGNGQIGRIDNPTERGNSIRNTIGRGQNTGRLGSTHYQTNNNQFGAPSNGRIDRFEVPNFNKGSIVFQSGRLGEARTNRYRNGYNQYNNNWRDDWFYYPHYQFNYGNNCSVSPWYYYSNLPGYISHTRVIYVNNFNGYNWGGGSVYNWNNGYNNNNNNYGNNQRNDELDDAVSDIRQAWERGDRRAISRLVPSRERVNIYHDGRYSYSLSGDDFYDMFADAIFSTDTDRYEIVSVRSDRGDASVKARHTFNDGWGRQSSVMHTYRLVGDRYGYQIADFSTGYNSLW